MGLLWGGLGDIDLGYYVIIVKTSPVNTFHYICFDLVTPLDVVKIRLQAQQNAMPSKRCFIYCNGLMDHCIICVNGNGNKSSTGALYAHKVHKEMWYKRPGHFNGTLVRYSTNYLHSTPMHT